MPTDLCSFFMAGFECSSHIRPDGVRLDLLASTRHDSLVAEDYAQVRAYGLRVVRDGVRWHLVESCPNVYDWSSWLPMVRAARDGGMQVIWDLCHYGWPEHLDIWSASFVDHFHRYACAAARVVRDETDSIPFYCPVNEISYWAWAGGDTARMNPMATGRADELKRQLVRAYLAAVDAVRSVDRRARFIVAEPLINVVGEGTAREPAQAWREAQFQAHDMLVGRMAPELGGGSEFLDIVGVNFYPHNQWYLGGGTIPMGHHAYRPLREMLVEVSERYGRPLIISETGAEASARPYWLHHVCGEVLHAIESGAEIQGVCLYPVLDYQGWDDERVCQVGLLSSAAEKGRRTVYAPLLEELQRQARHCVRPPRLRERLAV
jgi:beta-glucosidase/6-phospho-beta-glucosidase/beta-galactosidase